MASLHVRKVPREPLPIPRPLKPGDKIKLGNGAITLGRDKKSDCWLPEHTVSKHHARIEVQGGCFVIKDLESYNHTFVNDNRLPPAAFTPLRHGDEVRVCGYLFSFQEHDSDGVRSTVEASISPAPYPRILEAQPGDKLRTLLTLGGTLNKSLEATELFERAAAELFDLFKQADRCFVIQLDPNSGELLPVVVKTRHHDLPGPFSSTIVRRCLQTRDSFLSEDVTKEEELNENKSVVASPMRSVMCVPIVLSDGVAIGVVQLDCGDRSKKFTRDDLQFLMCVANQVAFAMEFIQLHETALLNAKLLHDLHEARTVQAGLLPQKLPEMPGYTFFTHYQPARSVGGDYYDFIPFGSGEQAILLGDVSGKGLSAALLMARLSGAAHLSCAASNDLAAAVELLNSQLLRANLNDRYITLTAVRLDPRQHRVAVVSAGHYSPWVYRASTRRVEEVMPDEDGGVPLGVSFQPKYAAAAAQIGPGDSIILFSDGILDAVDAEGKRFGRDKLRQVLCTDPGRPPLSARELGERARRAVEDHAGQCDQADDISLVCFGRSI